MRITALDLSLSESECDELCDKYCRPYVDVDDIKWQIDENHIAVSGKLKTLFPIPFTVYFRLCHELSYLIIQVDRIHAIGGFTNAIKNTILNSLVKQLNLDGVHHTESHIYINVNQLLRYFGVTADCKITQFTIDHQHVRLQLEGDLYFSRIKAAASM